MFTPLSWLDWNAPAGAKEIIALDFPIIIFQNGMGSMLIDKKLRLAGVLLTGMLSSPANGGEMALPGVSLECSPGALPGLIFFGI